MSKKLFVGGLSWNTTDSELQQAFEACGAVAEAKVITDRETGRSQRATQKRPSRQPLVRRE